MAGYTPGQVLAGKQVAVGGVTLGAVDSAGVAWTIDTDGLKGWDGPPVRTQYSDREADHGSYAGPTYLAARVISISGKIIADTQATLDTAMDQLAAAPGLTDTLLVVSETTPRQAMVRRSGEVLLRQETDRIAAYSLMVTATDPRRYSTTLQSRSTGLPASTGGITLPITLPLTITAGATSGQIILANSGTIAARPTITIGGPVTTPAVTFQYPDGTVKQLAYSDTLGAGDVLVIDTDAHTATLNGQVSRRRYLSGTWPEIPPGSSVTIQWTAASSDPAALLTGTCRSAWI
ncbi:phage tail family protein [Kitasatospora sp. NBC_00070]|uniref:phage distal tail protein n=1 Tax=Kitasatospora sp. NBC_00070 TaxID=2975962 RepID=UPI0032470D0F